MAQRPACAFVVAMAVFIAWLVGISHAMLGLHWASDVLAGWAALWLWIAARLTGAKG